MQDSNDIPFSSYSIDFFGAIGRLFSDTDAEDLSFIAEWVDRFVLLWNIYTAFAFLISLALLFGIIYAFIRANQLGAIEDEWILASERAYQEVYGTRAKHWRWNDVLTHIGNESPNDWKLAIIEADIMLGEALDSAGYAGTTIGDQLKSISPRQLQNLDAAWEAHKIRNQIAHSGSDFVLTKKLAQETVTRYKLVFEELKVI